MKIYRTTRQVEEFDVEDKVLLKLIQTYNLDDKRIQESKDLRELFDLYNINEYSPELDIFLTQGEITEGSIRTYYEDYGDAYHDMVYGEYC